MLMLILCLSLFLGGCEVESTNIEETTTPYVDVEMGNNRAMTRGEAECFKILDTKAQEHFENYDLSANGESFKLEVYMTKEDVVNGKWDEFAEALNLETFCYDWRIITFTFIVRDIDTDEVYMTIVNDEVVYNSLENKH